MATAVTAVASATGAVTSTIKAVDDIDDAVTGKHFLTNDQRNALSTVQAVAGAVAAVSGLTAMGGSLIGIDEAANATQDASESFIYTDEETESGTGADVPNNGNADVAGQNNNSGHYQLPSDVEPATVDVEGDDAGSGSELDIDGDDADSRSYGDSVMDSMSSSVSEPPPLQQAPVDLIPVQQDDLQDVLGSRNLDATDKAVINADPGLPTALNSTETSESLVDSSFAEVTPPTLTAMDGNFVDETEVWRNAIGYFLSWDDRLLWQWSELKNTLYTRLATWITQ